MAMMPIRTVPIHFCRALSQLRKVRSRVRCVAVCFSGYYPQITLILYFLLYYEYVRIKRKPLRTSRVGSKRLKLCGAGGN